MLAERKLAAVKVQRFRDISLITLLNILIFFLFLWCQQTQPTLEETQDSNSVLKKTAWFKK